MRTLVRSSWVLALCFGVGALPSAAEEHLLTDGASSVLVDDASQLGVAEWTVDGVNQIFQQWFWYRIGDSGPESSIDTLPFLAATGSDTDLDPGIDTLVLRYGSEDDFEVEVQYSLTGAPFASGLSSLDEQIRLVNNGTGVLDVHFFEYSDFDMCGTSDNDTVRLVSPGTVEQTDGGCGLSETIVSPIPFGATLAFFPDILESLNDDDPTTFGGVPADLTGDVAFAFQWDFEIGGGQSVVIDKTKQIRVPEPAAMTILGLGLGVLSMMRRTRRG
jgi:hypothetical protein